MLQEFTFNALMALAHLFQAVSDLCGDVAEAVNTDKPFEDIRKERAERVENAKARSKR